MDHMRGLIQVVKARVLDTSAGTAVLKEGNGPSRHDDMIAT